MAAALGHQAHVFAANRREDTVVQLDALAQGRQFHARAAPFMRADQANSSRSEATNASSPRPYASLQASFTSGARRSGIV